MSAAWPNTLRVQLVKRLDSGLGFKVRKAKDGPHLVVASVIPGGAAEESGLVQEGDRIISVQGVNVVGKPFNEALSVLNDAASGSCVTLLLRTPVGCVTHLETIFTPTGQPFSVRVTQPLNGDFVEPDIFPANGPRSSHPDSEEDDVSPDNIRPRYEDEPLPPQPLRFLLDEQNNAEDTLHKKAVWATGCQPHHCKGSMMLTPTPRPTGTVREREIVLQHAKDFFDEYFKESKKSSLEEQQRWHTVSKSIQQTGVYHHTPDELTFGCRTCWRNEPRCIGRMYWNRLKVLDGREARTAHDMFEMLCEQIVYSTNGGNIKAAITVFPPRTDGRHDYRIWNAQLIQFAGYTQPGGTSIGDPVNAEFTKVCERLGWKGAGGRFDVLPLVLQANGDDPEYFEIPEDIIMRVQIHHPKYPTFSDLHLQWYALPAVSGMMMDLGGLEFPAVSFSGWYMNTEIGARDLCDVNRYNMTKAVAEKLDLDTSSVSTLWQDRAMVEVNVAVIHSFQSQGVSILDHHSASKLFMQHMRSEQKSRGGCPGDWVWLVPPISGSLCPVFHQELLNYKLKPAYEYQGLAWKNHDVWLNGDAYDKVRGNTSFAFDKMSLSGSLRFRKDAEADSGRPACTILYGTETGNSEAFASQLAGMFKTAFVVRVLCMEDYDVSELEEESLLLVVTSTFGNGGPPENAEKFNSSLRKITDPVASDKPVRFAVFALGSSAYPRFCAFGKTVDEHLKKLGAISIHKLGEGDEMGSQEQDFEQWSKGVLQAASDVFKPRTSWQRPSLGLMMQPAEKVANGDVNSWSHWKYRLTPCDKRSTHSIADGLSVAHKRTVSTATLLSWTELHSKKASRQTCLAKLDISSHQRELSYNPGDHLVIFPENPKQLVDAVISRLKDRPDDPEKTVFRVQVMNDSTPNGFIGGKKWEDTGRLPPCTLREALTYYMDITSSPSRSLFRQMALLNDDLRQRQQMMDLVQDTQAYENWWKSVCPTIFHVLYQFSSLQLTTSFILTQIPLLKPRYYSISSSSDLHPTQLHLTVAMHKYKVSGDRVPLRDGLCSYWLSKLKRGASIPCAVRNAIHFHLPEDTSLPVTMVGTGAGVAPFRGFWQHREAFLFFNDNEMKEGVGPLTFYFGCRDSKHTNTYGPETVEATKNGSLSRVYRALSRQQGQKKQYVQDVMWINRQEIYREMVTLRGHLYVCGEVGMAENVVSAFVNIIEEEGHFTREEAEQYVTDMKNAGRLHEDIFGVKQKLVVDNQKNRPKLPMRETCTTS